jgi:AraC-like DNA-binding protein
MTRESTRDARVAIYEEAVAIAAAELAAPITLEQVARRLATSPRQVQRAFTDVGGMGFREHLRRLRMAQAVELLSSTDLPVKEVAHRVGYRDHSQFSKSFKRTYGFSPIHARARAGQVDALPPATRSIGAGRG